MRICLVSDSKVTLYTQTHTLTHPLSLVMMKSKELKTSRSILMLILSVSHPAWHTHTHYHLYLLSWWDQRNSRPQDLFSCWYPLSLSPRLTHSHSLSLVLVVIIKSKELKTKIYSHADTHSVSHPAWYTHTHYHLYLLSWWDQRNSRPQDLFSCWYSLSLSPSMALLLMSLLILLLRCRCFKHLTVCMHPARLLSSLSRRGLYRLRAKLFHTFTPDLVGLYLSTRRIHRGGVHNTICNQCKPSLARNSLGAQPQIRIGFLQATTMGQEEAQAIRWTRSIADACIRLCQLDISFGDLHNLTTAPPLLSWFQNLVQKITCDWL